MELSYIAHRGGRDYGDDNRLKTIILCQEDIIKNNINLHGIEVDCLPTNDGSVVLEHNLRLQNKKINTLSLKQIKEINSQILSLDEFIKLINKFPKQKIILDIKPLTSTSLSKITIDNITSILSMNNTNLLHDIEIQSFIPEVVTYARERNYNTRLILGVPSLPYVFVKSLWFVNHFTSLIKKDINKYLIDYLINNNINNINLECNWWNPYLINTLLSHEINVIAGNTNNPKDVKNLIKMNCSVFYSDNPVKLHRSYQAE